MTARHLRPLAVACLVLALDGLVVAMVIWPRVESLGTATTGGGAVTLKVIAASMAVAGLVPIASFANGHVVVPATVSFGVLGTSVALILSFNERNTSDGLFVMPLIAGAFLIVALSGFATARLRRRGASRPTIESAPNQASG